MSSRKEYLNFLLEQLSDVAGITCRPMMGEYLLYCRGKLLGGVYDDRLLVKSIPAAKALLPNAPEELPYPGGKPMLLVEEVDSRETLVPLMEALYEALPAPRPRRKSKTTDPTD